MEELILRDSKMVIAPASNKLLWAILSDCNVVFNFKASEMAFPPIMAQLLSKIIICNSNTLILT